jgi:hypothetical protein
VTQIALTRCLARQLRAVFRKCYRKPLGPHPPLVKLQGGRDGLKVSVAHQEVSIAYHQPGTCPACDGLYLPLEALADFEGRTQDSVRLETVAPHKTLARWQEASVPQVVEYAVENAEKQPEFPKVPAPLHRCEPGILQALDQAVQTASPDAFRYAINRLQLRGKAGEIIATDGKQLLIQGGFTFPWQENLLVPRLAAFGCKELGDDPIVEIGRTNTHVVLRIAAWTFFLKIDADARYPDVDAVIPKAGEGVSLLRIAPEDATFLAKTLPRLPGQDDENSPVTVDLNGRVSLRARAAAQEKATEVVLARSDYEGKPVQVCVNRDYLARAVQLGFGLVQIASPDTPLLFRNESRVFVCMPLSKEGFVAAGEDTLRIASAEEVRPRKTPIERKKPTVTTNHQPSGNGHAPAPRQPEQTQPPSGQGQGGYGELLAEALALKQTLHDAHARSKRLVAAIKRQRQQSRLVASTLASLRHLQRIT